MLCSKSSGLSLFHHARFEQNCSYIAAITPNCNKKEAETRISKDNHGFHSESHSESDIADIAARVVDQPISMKLQRTLGSEPLISGAEKPASTQ